LLKILVNDQLVDADKAVVSAYDHGFLYGLGVFETFRTYRGKPFLLKEHVSRLQEGCAAIGIDFAPDTEQIQRQIGRLLAANNLPDGYFRYTVSAGKSELGLPSGNYSNATVIVYVKPLPPVHPELAEKGKSLQLLRLRRNTPEGPARLKSFHYMNNILGKRELAARSFTEGAEGLFLTAEGYLAEGIVSNLFFIRDHVCCTPSLETGILPGITRAFVIELAKNLNMEVAEGLYRWQDLWDAEEIFLTNSIQEIVPVTQLFDTEGNRKTVGSGTAGLFTRKLLQKYRAQTGGY
jgi:4-amino-4-deoxychorismate lyase